MCADEGGDDAGGPLLQYVVPNRGQAYYRQVRIWFRFNLMDLYVAVCFFKKLIISFQVGISIADSPRDSECKVGQKRLFYRLLDKNVLNFIRRTIGLGTGWCSY